MWISFPSEVEAYPLKFGARLGPGDTLVASSVNVQRRTGPDRYEPAPVGFSAAVATVEGEPGVYVTKQAATPGEQAPGLYQLFITVSTSSGRTLVEDPWLYLKPAA